MNIYTCKCGSSHKNIGLLSIHIRKEHYDNDENIILKNSFYCDISNKFILNDLKNYHEKQILNCKNCNVKFFKNNSTSFCCSSCAASFNNKNRKQKLGGKKKATCVSCGIDLIVSNRSNLKRTRCSKCKKIHIKKYKDSINPLIINGVKYNKCHHCDKLFERVGNRVKKFCDDHKDKYTAGARKGYIFSFDYEKYPDLFDIDTIKNIGFFSTSESPRDYNKLVKDHKISVHDAIKYGYDSYYISHPMNCDFISARNNNEKHKNSSLSYEELVLLVDEYDKKKR